MNEKDKLMKATTIDVLEWLLYAEEGELAMQFFSGKISANSVYNRYLDDKKR